MYFIEGGTTLLIPEHLNNEFLADNDKLMPADEMRSKYSDYIFKGKIRNLKLRIMN